MASRLSEIPEWNVLLLEAGGEPGDFQKVLGLYPYTIYSKLNWGYNTTRQKNACLGNYFFLLLYFLFYNITLD